MKIIGLLFLLVTMSSCAHKVLVKKDECEDVHGNIALCTEVE